MTNQEAKIGMRATFKSKRQSDRSLNGKVGTIMLDAKLEKSDDWGGNEALGDSGSCFWRVDGEQGVNCVALADLVAEKPGAVDGREAQRPKIIRQNFRLMCTRCKENLGSHLGYRCVDDKGEFTMKSAADPVSSGEREGD